MTAPITPVFNSIENTISIIIHQSPVIMSSEAPESQHPAASQNGRPDESQGDMPEIPSIPDSRLPTRKDTSLREFINKIDDYAPIVRPSFPISRLYIC